MWRCLPALSDLYLKATNHLIYGWRQKAILVDLFALLWKLFFDIVSMDAKDVFVAVMLLSYFLAHTCRCLSLGCNEFAKNVISDPLSLLS